MKKFILAAGVLLLAAVFMSGCITAPASDDPIVGIWDCPLTETSSIRGPVFESHTFVFNADGTAYSLAKFADSPVSGKLDFTWENLGDGKYLVTIVDKKNSGISDVLEFEFKDGVLTDITAGLEFSRITLEDYAPGLWTGGKVEISGYTDVQALLYLGEDGTGNVAVYGPAVTEHAEVFQTEIFWKADGDKLTVSGPKGVSFDAALVNGELVFAGIYPGHKYTIEDNLYGLWESEELFEEDGVSYEIVQVLKSDGTGTEIWTVPGSDAASKKYSYTWKMINPLTYEAVYEDGEVWEFDAVFTQLFDGETWYNKVGFDILQEYAEGKAGA